MSENVEVQPKFVRYLELEYPIDIWMVCEVYEMLLVFLIYVLAGNDLVKVRTGHVTRQASRDFLPHIKV